MIVEGVEKKEYGKVDMYLNIVGEEKNVKL